MIRNSKKYLLLILCLFILGIFTSACGGGGKSTPPSYPFIPIPAPTVSPTPEPTPTPEKYQLELSQTEFTVNVGETDNIIVTLNGDDITETATYTVDQEAIASVEKGLITGLSAGFATVTVHADEAEADKTFTVNVIDPSLPTLELSQTEFNLFVDDEDTVTVFLNGEDVTEQVAYESDDESVATAEKGVVKTKYTEGTANVTVSLEGANSATFKVNVTDNSEEVELDEDVLEELGYKRVKNGDNYDIKRIADGEIITNLEIPAIYTYDGDKYKITSIIDIFVNCTSLESVTIPNSVTYIGEEAFRNCTNSNLSIDIPSSVTDIIDDAFENVNNINISETQKDLDDYP